MQRTSVFSAVPIPLIALALAFGCAPAIEQRSTGASGFGLPLRSGGAAPAGADEPHPCVMEVPGTGIRVRDIDGGVEVVFDTVAPSSIGDLRRAVRGLVGVLSTGHASVRHDHSRRALALARRYRRDIGELPALEAAVEDMRRGARLELRASDASQVSVLRQKMRAEIAAMQRGVCLLVDAPH